MSTPLITRWTCHLTHPRLMLLLSLIFGVCHQVVSSVYFTQRPYHVVIHGRPTDEQAILQVHCLHHQYQQHSTPSSSRTENSHPQMQYGLISTSRSQTGSLNPETEPGGGRSAQEALVTSTNQTAFAINTTSGWVYVNGGLSLNTHGDSTTFRLSVECQISDDHDTDTVHKDVTELDVQVLHQCPATRGEEAGHSATCNVTVTATDVTFRVEENAGRVFLGRWTGLSDWASHCPVVSLQGSQIITSDGGIAAIGDVVNLNTDTDEVYLLRGLDREGGRGWRDESEVKTIEVRVECDSDTPTDIVTGSGGTPRASARHSHGMITNSTGRSRGRGGGRPLGFPPKKNTSRKIRSLSSGVTQQITRLLLTLKVLDVNDQAPSMFDSNIGNQILHLIADGRDLPTTCTILDADSDSGSYAATIFPTSNAQYFETIFRKVRNGFQLRLRARPESDPPEKDYYLRIVSNDTTYRPRHILNNDWQSKSAVTCAQTVSLHAPIVPVHQETPATQLSTPSASNPDRQPPGQVVPGAHPRTADVSSPFNTRLTSSDPSDNQGGVGTGLVSSVMMSGARPDSPPAGGANGGAGAADGGDTRDAPAPNPYGGFTPSTLLPIQYLMNRSKGSSQQGYRSIPDFLIKAPTRPSWRYRTTSTSMVLHISDSTSLNTNTQEVTESAKPLCGVRCRLAIGAVLAGILLIVLVSLLVWRLHRKRKQASLNDVEKFVGSSVSLSALPTGIVDTQCQARSSRWFLPPHSTIVNTDYIDGSERPNHQNSVFSPHGAAPDASEWTNINGYVIKPDPKWEFPRRRIKLEKTLGEGEFGHVMRAQAYKLNSRQGCTTVAVKMLKESHSDGEFRDLLSEYNLLKDVSHRNVIKLLGACTQQGPFYVIVEYCEHGALRSYLRKCRGCQGAASMRREDTSPKPEVEFHLDSAHACVSDCEETECYQVTAQDLLSFCWQIANGMSYLCDMKLVHRDLAARNVLVTSGKVLKISDFGLTRDVYEGDTYLKKSKGRIPVKWMAPESLYHNVYTPKSDVWSFGIVVWEIVTLGGTPYSRIPAERLYEMLKSQYRMPQPRNCSKELYAIMSRCWQERSKDRPSFKSLVDTFERMLAENVNYLDLRVLERPSPPLEDDLTDQATSSSGDACQEPDYGSINILSMDDNAYVVKPKTQANYTRNGDIRLNGEWHGANDDTDYDYDDDDDNDNGTVIDGVTNESMLGATGGIHMSCERALLLAGEEDGGAHMTHNEAGGNCADLDVTDHLDRSTTELLAIENETVI